MNDRRKVKLIAVHENSLFKPLEGNNLTRTNILTQETTSFVINVIFQFIIFSQDTF